MKTKAKNFTITPNSLIFDSNLTNSEFRVLLALKSHGYGENKIFPSQGSIADKLKVNRRTVNMNVRGLIKKGYILVKKRGYSMSNQYFIREENFSDDQKLNENNDTSNVKNSSHQMRTKVLTNNTVVNNIKEKYEFDRETKIIEQTRVKYPFLAKRY